MSSFCSAAFRSLSLSVPKAYLHQNKNNAYLHRQKNDAYLHHAILHRAKTAGTHLCKSLALAKKTLWSSN
eukprot:5504112-Pleurochrysis_carterae.AAC.3